MSKAVISVKHLTKIYKLYDKPVDRLKESLHPLKKQYHKEFYALKNVSFEIKKGETVGIIGKNGAGKSTLLKIITGVLTPTNGSVNVTGRIASLLELGAGFNSDYTGIENIYFQGSLMGYTRVEMEVKIDEILAFADIGDFVYQSVKTYSSGMFARLAFAVAINVDPDILIVDEALSVGDSKFQNKCLARIKSMQEKGVTIFFVSHSTAQINSICTYAIWINNGEIKELGDVLKVTSLYTYDQNSSSREALNENNESSMEHDDEFGAPTDIEKLYDDATIKVIGYKLLNSKNIKTNTFDDIGQCKLITKFFSARTISHPLIGFGIYNYLDESIIHFNSENLVIQFETINENSEFIIDITFQMPNLQSGTYIIKIGIDDGTIGSNEELLHVILTQFEFISRKKQNGYLIVDSNISINGEN